MGEGSRQVKAQKAPLCPNHYTTRCYWHKRCCKVLSAIMTFAFEYGTRKINKSREDTAKQVKVRQPAASRTKTVKKLCATFGCSD